MMRILMTSSHTDLVRYWSENDIGGKRSRPNPNPL